MIKFIITIVLSFILMTSSFCQNKPTIAVEPFKLQPIGLTNTYSQAKWRGDLDAIGNAFAASFTEKLRKAGYTVVTRRNIDSLLDENRLAQSGIVDDEGSTKLRAADYRIIGTIQQFEESEDSRGLAGIVGVVAGKKTTQMKGDVSITVEMIARDGTVIASSYGKSSKTGRINDLGGFAGKVDGKIFALVSNTNKGAASEAITNASNHAIELAVKDLALQLKKIDLSTQKMSKLPVVPLVESDFNGTKFVVSFPDSPVAEEVFSDALSSMRARIILGSVFKRDVFNNNDNLEAYCLNLRKTTGNAKYFIFGIIDSDRVNNQTNRISMSIKVIDLANLQLVHSESAQGSSNDISNKAGQDRAVKETANKLLYSAIAKIENYSKTSVSADNQTYTLELSGFQSLSSANRFIKILKKNSNVESCEVVDFSDKTLFAEIKFKNNAVYSEILEKDDAIIDMFVVSIKKVTNYKIVGDVILR